MSLLCFVFLLKLLVHRFHRLLGHPQVLITSSFFFLRFLDSFSFCYTCSASFFLWSIKLLIWDKKTNFWLRLNVWVSIGFTCKITRSTYQKSMINEGETSLLWTSSWSTFFKQIRIRVSRSIYKHGFSLVYLYKDLRNI